MKKKVLLIGGCGFIGHNLALLLNKKGYDVSILDSLGVNNLLTFTDKEIKNKNLYRSILNERLDLMNINKIRLIFSDARELNNYSKIFEELKPDIVIHLAAVSHANKSNKDPHNTFDNSLRTLESTLEICRKNKTQIIYFSSSMVYGNFETGMVNEDTKCNPIGIYGNLKLACEMMVKSYSHVFDIPYTIIRPSALYGERCVSRRVGQIFIENLLTNNDIAINGDGSDKLDFTYIEDLIDGIEKCCSNNKAINQTFNLTYGKARKISDLIEILNGKFDNFKVIKKDREHLMPERGTLDISKARDLIGYEPKFPIEVGYVNYINWYKEFTRKLNVI